MKEWKTWTGPSQVGRVWSRGPKSALSKILQNKEHYITNLHKPKFKNEAYLTLKNKSLNSLCSIMKVGFSGVDLESMILSESGKAKVQQANMF